jgi:hypothetical protein
MHEYWQFFLTHKSCCSLLVNQPINSMIVKSQIDVISAVGWQQRPAYPGRCVMLTAGVSAMRVGDKITLPWMVPKH